MLQAETKVQSPSPCMCLLSSTWEKLPPLAGTQDKDVCLPVPPHDPRHQSLSPTAGYISVWRPGLAALSSAEKDQVGHTCIHHSPPYVGPFTFQSHPKVWAALSVLRRSTWVHASAQKDCGSPCVLLLQPICHAG